MNFAGSEQFDCGPAELWACLTDMGFVSRVIPDVERIASLEQTGFSCRVRPRFSFLTGSLDLTFEIIDSAPPGRLKVRSRGKGIGAAVVVEAELLLAADGSGTKLQWSGAIVAREGLLKPVGPGLIQGAAQRVIDSFWKNFRDAMLSDGGMRNVGD
jgi:carbon monoxide dehydrogenase subunit G